MEQSRTYRKIFVVGCPRSGTSWTSKMISQSSAVVRLPGESHLYKLLYDPFTYLPKIGWRKRIKRRTWIFKHYGVGGIGPLLTGFNSQNMWAGLAQVYRFYKWSGHGSGPHMCVDYEEFLELIEAARAEKGDDLTRVKQLIESVLEAAFYAQGGDRNKIMLEKTPMHIKYADVILDSFAEAKMIEVVRDVRGVCASWQARAKTQRWPRKPTVELVDQWIKCVEWGDKFKQDSSIGDRILRVRYEDLKQDPAGWLKTIFEFIELPVDEQTINSIAEAFNIDNIKQKGEGQHIRKGVVGAWKDDLSAADIEICNRLAGPLLEKLGYTTVP